MVVVEEDRSVCSVVDRQNVLPSLLQMMMMMRTGAAAAGSALTGWR